MDTTADQRLRDLAHSDGENVRLTGARREAATIGADAISLLRDLREQVILRPAWVAKIDALLTRAERA